MKRLLGLAFVGLVAAPAGAFQLFDGKLEIHGYGAEQVRALSKNFAPHEDLDLAQWYHVLSVELEAKPFPGGIGPLEIVEFYARAEARYDCVWTRACGVFPSVDTYGNRADHLPQRLSDGRYAGFAGTMRTGDRRYYNQVTRDDLRLENATDRLHNDQKPLRFTEIPGLVPLYAFGFGPNQRLDPIDAWSDDPGVFHFLRQIDRCKFAASNSRGGENGQVADVIGPWNPSCPIEANGALRLHPNPFNAIDANPILMGPDRIPYSGDEPIDPATTTRNNGQPTGIQPFGKGALPFRPAPPHGFLARGLELDEAQGLYVPSPGLVRAIRGGELDPIDQNFGQQELAWNRGASQQDEKELKEAYVDIEAAEGRLWLRLGRQTIVWGKTELFRNTDQFNPQDFGMASIPDLEASRIALWAARGTWSFYNVGRLEDVRLEIAANFDDSEPADFGRCGEPFALELVCGITLGYFAHGFAGIGLAGVDDPPAAWEDPSGIEGGARLEWRYKRFSFQLSDFWGYDDFPYPRRITTYERNVDPATGRPRRAGARGPCATGAEPACLGRPDAVAMGSDGQPLRMVDTPGADGLYDGIPDTPIERGPGLNIEWSTGTLIVDPAHTADVLANHPANQTTFAVANILCGAAGNVDPSLCGLAALNGHGGPGIAFGSTAAVGAGAVFAGSRFALSAASNGGFYCTIRDDRNISVCRDAVGGALRLINRDPGDDVGLFSDGGPTPFAAIGVALGQRLSPQQEALWGCGPFYQADCDVDGVDFLNAEASAVLQSWPGFEGTRGSVWDWDTRSPGQPGTVGFLGGPVATRWDGEKLVILPGARGPGDAGYAPSIDGCVGPGPFGCNAGDGGRAADATLLLHPMSGEAFRNELAVVSWNWLVAVATGGREIEDPTLATLSEFDPYDPYGIGIRPANAPNGGVPRAGIDVDAALRGEPTACGLYKILLCENVRSFLGSAVVRRNSVRAGGSNGFGRRDFAWQTSGEVVLDYQKRNVLGFAFDFDEEKTRSNWGVEATWVSAQPFVDNDSPDNVTTVDTWNLTVSVDRPTFIDFLNPGRTFFINSQWFFQYIGNYGKNFYANGPFNVLGTLTVFSGYFQDRLMAFNTVVYDVNSRSGAVIPSIAYRFTESFSVTVGVNVFFGSQQMRDAAINELRPLNRVERNAYEDAVDAGLTALRDRDEVYLLLRATF